MARNKFNIKFYDCECLPDLFTIAVYTPPKDNHGELDIYWLSDNIDTINDTTIDPETLEREIKAANKRLVSTDPHVTIRSLNLRNSKNITRIFNTFGVHPNQIRSKSFKTDVDDDFDPVNNPDDYFIMGYNSYNYDINIMSAYFTMMNAFNSSQPDMITPRNTAGLIKTMYVNIPGTHDDKNITNFKYASQIRYINDTLFDNFKKKMANAYKDLSNSGAKISENFSISSEFFKDALEYRKEILSKGRNLDVARCNEKAKYAALKNILGIMGHQILEYSGSHGFNNSVDTPEEFYKLTAYNTSDVVNLSPVFEHNNYYNAFEQKRAMLLDSKDILVPEGGYRLFADSTSAQLVTKLLSGDTKLPDYPKVSLMYPHPDVANKENIKPFNVLTEVDNHMKEWFSPESDAYKNWTRVKNVYSQIENQDFSLPNNGFYGDTNTDDLDNLDADQRLKSLMNENMNLLYYDRNGNPTSCYTNFSIGGIHGAEYNKNLIQAKIKSVSILSEILEKHKTYLINLIPIIENIINTYKTNKEDYQSKQQTFHDMIYTEILNAYGSDIARPHEPHGKIISANIYEYLNSKYIQNFVKKYEFNTLKFKENPAYFLRLLNQLPGLKIPYKSLLKSDAVNNPDKNMFKPVPDQITFDNVFTKSKKSDDNNNKYILDKSYKFTSSSFTYHDDFKSYYPNMLVNMKAFAKPKQTNNTDNDSDKYEEFYYQKEEYGGLAKQAYKSGDTALGETYTMKRSNVKLILNSASGAANTQWDTNINMPNKIISMRMIGQLFTFLIAQKLTYDGGNVPSTNTDGLYAADLKASENEHVLELYGEKILIDIEPEPMWLISKDSNNRIEFTIDNPGETRPEYMKYTIQSAGGGHLACYKGFDLSRSIDHPIILDWLLAHYLIRKKDNLYEPFDRTFATKLIKDFLFSHSLEDILLYFTYIIKCNPNKNFYYFTYTDTYDNIVNVNDIDYADLTSLNHYTRILLVKQDTPESVRVMGAKAKAGKPEHHPVATYIFKQNGIDVIDKPIDELSSLEKEILKKTIALQKVNGLDPDWKTLIVNESLFELDLVRKKELVDSIDIDKYLDMLDSIYTDNWKNISVQEAYPEMQNFNSIDIIKSDILKFSEND